MAGANRPRVCCDVECYRNYFLVKFRTLDGRRIVSCEMSNHHTYDRQRVIAVLKHYTLITFNGNGYDKWMILASLKTTSTTSKLKDLSDAIIKGGMRPWEVGREFGLEEPGYLDHIDLIEPAPGVQVGLKIYAGRMHSPRMQDLPYDPDTLLTLGQMNKTNLYCGNDLEVTGSLHNCIHEAIVLREKMSNEYGIDMRSKSDAQIGEAILRQGVERVLGRKVYKPELPKGYSCMYAPPAFIRFQTREMRAVLQEVVGSRFYLDKNGSPVIPKAIDKLDVRIGGKRYNLQIGGLHSCEQRQVVEADDGHIVRDIDVKAFYPNIIINCGLYPKHLTKAFIPVYAGIVRRREDAKPSGKHPNPQVDKSLKIVINGSYGKFGSKYSVLYSPDLMLYVCLTGQLSLLMLIEALELAGIPVMSANTDGIVVRCPVELEGTLNTIVADWEFMTGFDMEATDYLSLNSRDVNSYVAVKPDGTVKTKGAYARNITINKKGEEEFNLQKTPTTEVCIDAVIEYLTKGTPLRDTIEACQDIRKFVSVRRVTGGAWLVHKAHYSNPTQKVMRQVLEQSGWVETDVKIGRAKGWVRRAAIDTMGHTVYSMSDAFDSATAAHGEDFFLGKVVRWAYATDAKTFIRNAKGSKVAKTDGCRPLMDLPDEFPDWLDYDWYEREAAEMLADLGVK